MDGEEDRGSSTAGIRCGLPSVPLFPVARHAWGPPPKCSLVCLCADFGGVCDAHPILRRLAAAAHRRCCCCLRCRVPFRSRGPCRAARVVIFRGVVGGSLGGTGVEAEEADSVERRDERTSADERHAV
jgi:hypothetical protein